MHTHADTRSKALARQEFLRRSRWSPSTRTPWVAAPHPQLPHEAPATGAPQKVNDELRHRSRREVEWGAPASREGGQQGGGAPSGLPSHGEARCAFNDGHDAGVTRVW